MSKRRRRKGNIVGHGNLENIFDNSPGQAQTAFTINFTQGLGAFFLATFNSRIIGQHNKIDGLLVLVNRCQTDKIRLRRVFLICTDDQYIQGHVRALLGEIFTAYRRRMEMIPRQNGRDKGQDYQNDDTQTAQAPATPFFRRQDAALFLLWPLALLFCCPCGLSFVFSVSAVLFSSSPGVLTVTCVGGLRVSLSMPGLPHTEDLRIPVDYGADKNGLVLL